MLDGQVQIRHHLFIAAQRGNEFIRDALGVSVQDADPADSLHPVQLVQQLADAVFAPVAAVGGGILRHQHQLPDPFACQPTGLGHSVGQRAAAQRAPDQRDGTVMAAVVAALGDL